MKLKYSHFLAIGKIQTKEYKRNIPVFIKKYLEIL